MSKYKPELIETTELCSYGCGQLAKFKFENGKLCCSKTFSGCPTIRNKIGKQNKIKIIPESIETIKLCDFGCGQIAKFKLSNGKLCCNKNWQSCPSKRKQNSENRKKETKAKGDPIKTTELCSYGCGQIANYKLKNGKLCCNEIWQKCPEKSKQTSNRTKGIKQTKPVKIETTELCDFGCGQIAKYKFKSGTICCSINTNNCPNKGKNKIIPKPVLIETTELCDFGCGQIAKYKFKSGKLCCGSNINKCPINKEKIKINMKTKPIKTTELCSYGCGQVAKFKLKNKKLCCEDHINKCPINSKKIKSAHKLIPIKTTELCSYGCGKIAKFKLKNGKLCCSNSPNKCPINCKKFESIKTTELCSYDCGQIANYKLKNGKLCCSKTISECPMNRKKLKYSHKAIPIKTTELCSYGCGQIAKYKLKNGKLCCSNNFNKCPINSKKIKLTIEKIKERYPTFYKEEELRYNPEKLNEKEIQVRCKYNKCKNSKENDGWFTPTMHQIHQRVDCIEKDYGNGGGFFYCSDKCKEKCFLFAFNPNHFLNNQNTESPHTQAEINIWRQEVLRRQKDRDGYNSCEMCESRENLQVHHEKPQKTHPGMTLDPDNGIILCKKCHYKYGHKTGTECSTGNLANKKYPC